MAVIEATSRVDVGRERLAAAVDALTSGESWRAWLESRARFRNYSFGNTLLIAFQRPDATQVAGFQAWKSMGRQVRKGEKGIAILAPIVRRAADDDERTVVGFRTVYVFDVDQTDGEALPEVPCWQIDGDSGLTHVADVLAGHAMAEGLDIERASIEGGANGYIDRARRRVVIDADLARDQSLKTLVHELAHWHDLGPDTAAYSRPDAEIVAESVAFIVSAAVGLDTTSYSAGYVATWAAGHSARLHDLAGRIDAAARPLLAALV